MMDAIRDDRSWYAGLVGGVICWALIAWAILAPAGCADATPPRPVPVAPPPPPVILPPAPPPIDPPADPLPALRAERDQLRADLAAVDSRLRSAEAEARVAPLRALTTWAMWIGGIAALAGVVGLILLRVGAPWMPVGGRFCVGVAVAGLGLVVAAAGLAQALPWLPVVGLILLAVLLLAGLAWAAITWRRGGRAVAAEWRAYADEVPVDIRRRLDEFSRLRQGGAVGAVDQLLAVPGGVP
jgi:uncharacterized membrane protein